MSDIGHNSDAEFKEISSQINGLIDQKEDIEGDIKDLYTLAKSKGINAAALRKSIKQTREDADERAARLEMEETIEIYTKKLEGLHDLPLGQAAIANRMAG